MNDFLHALLNDELDFHHFNYNSIPQYRAIQQTRDAQFEKIKKALGAGFADEVWSAAADAAGIEWDLAFERGFRLAGRFLLSMLA